MLTQNNNILKIIALISAICLVTFYKIQIEQENIINLPTYNTTKQLYTTHRNPRLGMATLALLHSRFPVMEAYRVLKHSKTPAFSFVYGTFGTDPTNYYKLMDELLSNELPTGLVVEIYTLCGPCRPPRTKGHYIKRFCPHKSIRNLKHALETKNKKITTKYKHWLKSIIKNFIDPYTSDTRIRFTIVPELEDNQSAHSFKKLLKVNKNLLKAYPRIKFVRNKLGDFFKGTPLNKEFHTMHANVLTIMGSGDVLSLDGSFWTFPEEEAAGVHLSASFRNIQRLIKSAKRHGVHLYLWRPEWQGLGKEHGKKLHPKDRTYRITYKNRLIQLIR